MNSNRRQRTIVTVTWSFDLVRVWLDPFPSPFVVRFLHSKSPVPGRLVRKFSLLLEEKGNRINFI